MKTFISKRQFNKFLKSGASAIAIAAFMTTAVQAAEQEVDETSIAAEDELEDEDEIEEVLVTGSRIRRNEFTSASPVQIISGEISREIGQLTIP